MLHSSRVTFLRRSTPRVLALMFAVLPLAGQTGLGVVRGTATDPSGAVLPKAMVTLTNTVTGVGIKSETSEVGAFYFGSVRPGPYTVEITAPGFKRFSGNLQVEVGQTAVVDASMEVGTVDTTVEVTGAAPIIATEGAQVSDVKDALRISQLPLNGRQITNLFNLTAGVEGGGNPRVNGLKVGSVEMAVDGVSLTDRFGGGIARVQPGLLTIQEYRIETSGSNAQYSRPATVSLITKSGTNEIHGDVFWTHRNNFGGLRARQRQDSASTPPQYIRNEYGFDIGGPIIRNKTFWYFAYEGQKERQARFAQASVATEAMWNGDFSNATTANSERITIYNPFTTRPDGTRDPFPGNIIPQNLIKPIAATMKGVSALPNAAGNPWIEPNFQAYYPITVDVDTFTTKIDHNLSEKDTLAGSFTRSVRPRRVFGGQYGFPPPGSTDAGGTGRQDSKVYTGFGRWNRIFTPTFFNEFQASASRSTNSSGTLADNTDWAKSLGFPNPFGVTGWPTICTDSPFFYYGCWDADNRGDQNLTAFTIENNVTWIKGKHSVKFGFKGKQEYNNVRELQQAQGSHSFYGDWTALYDPAGDQAASFTGSGFASMLLGLPTYLSNQYNRGYFYFQQKEIGAYIHDSWRFSNRLTLDLGVRWDKWTVYKEKYDRLVNLDLTKSATGMEVITPHNTRLESIQGIPPSVLQSWAARGLTWKTADEAGFPGGLLPADNNNFAPRLGVAFRLTDKTVLRGGYGIYYWTMPLSQILQSSRTNPPLNLRFQNSLSDLNGEDQLHALTNVPTQNEFIGSATVNVEGIAGISRQAQAMMPWDIHSWSDNMAQEWTFTLERELMRNTSLRLSYIGNHGSNLEQRWRWNDPESEFNYQARTGLLRPTNPDLRRVNPNWTSGCCNAPVQHNGYSNTNSFQVEVQRRYSNGLAFQWFYTYAHAMTTSDTGGFNFGSSGINTSGSGSAFAVPENILIWGEPNLDEAERLRLGYANSSEVPPQRMRWNGIWDIPVGKGKKFGQDLHTALHHVLGGWQVAFIGDWRSGQWSSVNAGRYLFGDPTLSADERLEMNIFGRRQRLWFRGDFDPTVATNVDQAKLQQLIPTDRSQRVLRPLGPNFDNRVPQTLADGTVRLTPVAEMLNWNARNFFRGPGAFNQDLSVFKWFSITERVRTRVTADFFNVFNHPIDIAPNDTTGLQDLSRQSNDPRIIQFSLRVEW
jgi:hypothetical protein